MKNARVIEVKVRLLNHESRAQSSVNYQHTWTSGLIQILAATKANATQRKTRAAPWELVGNLADGACVYVYACASVLVLIKTNTHMRKEFKDVPGRGRSA